MRKVIILQILLLFGAISCQKDLQLEEENPVKSDVSVVTGDVVDSLMQVKYGLQRLYLSSSEISALCKDGGQDALVTAYASERTKKLYLLAIPDDMDSKVPVYIYNQSIVTPKLLRTIYFENHEEEFRLVEDYADSLPVSSQAARACFFKRKKEEKYSDCYNRLVDDFCDGLMARIAYETHLEIRLIMAVMCAEEESSSDNEERVR